MFGVLSTPGFNGFKFSVVTTDREAHVENLAQEIIAIRAEMYLVDRANRLKDTVYEVLLLCRRHGVRLHFLNKLGLNDGLSLFEIVVNHLNQRIMYFVSLKSNLVERRVGLLIHGLLIIEKLLLGIQVGRGQATDRDQSAGSTAQGTEHYC